MKRSQTLDEQTNRLLKTVDKKTLIFQPRWVKQRINSICGYDFLLRYVTRQIFRQFRADLFI